MSSQLTNVPSRRRRRAIIGALLSVHALLVLLCSVEDFATYDEIGNLAAGVAYWECGTYYLYNVNPPLTKLLAALPVVLVRPDTSALVCADVPGTRPEWDLGDAFARSNAGRYHAFLVMARLAGLGWSLLGACLVQRWASRLWGDAGGLLALAVWCFEPNIITHAHLLNADLPAAVAALAAALACRRYLHRPSWGTAYVAGIVLGVAQLCKFTLVVLYPIWVVLWVVFRCGAAAEAGQPKTSRLQAAAQLGFLFATCLFVLNLGYEFDGAGKQLGDYPFVSQTFRGTDGESTGRSGNRFAGTWLGRLPMPVPEAYLRGIDVQRRDFERPGRYSYLGGQWRIGGGWWHYYLYAAAVKVPLGLWGIFLLAVAWPWRGRWAVRCRHGWRDLLILWLPAVAVLTLATSQRSLQSHFRYVLPMFPFLIVFTGRVGALISGGIPSAPRGRLTEPEVRTTDGDSRRLSQWGRVIVAGLLIWAAGSYLFVHPYALGYFNELAGGPHGGQRHLLGSNIDWGQDLFRLRRWMDRHPEAGPWKIAYFNRIDPRIIGVEFDLPPPGMSDAKTRKETAERDFGPHPGSFAISVRLLYGYPASPPDGQGGYRFAPFRSYEYFQQFDPVGKAGYSVFIYRITHDQARAVRVRLGLPPLPSGASGASGASRQP